LAGPDEAGAVEAGATGGWVEEPGQCASIVPASAASPMKAPPSKIRPFHMPGIAYL